MQDAVIKNFEPFSVLISVYAKESPANLESALDSIFGQSLPPNEVILVKDGPLSASLLAVIDSRAKSHPEMRVVSLDKNVGLGAALEFGLTYCSYELVARMDADDICAPNRFECQIPVLALNHELTVVGSWVAEFEKDPDNVTVLRKVPELSADIASFAKYRSPVNHPTVVFRKSHIQAVGGYKSNYLYYEDYYLWCRLIIGGYNFRNIPSALVLMRTGDGLYNRRGGLGYFKTELKFFIELYRINFIGFATFLNNIIVRLIVRLMPPKVREIIYMYFARSLREK